MPKFPVPRMRRRPLASIVAVTWLAGALLSGAPALASAPRNSSITVSAAISLKNALDDLGAAYEKTHPGAQVTMNYAGSGTLQHQIEQGAPVDIFFSAAEQQMNALQSEGLILAATRRNVVANELVLIVPAHSAGVHSFQDLTRSNVKIVALGEPSTVPAGMYAQQTLKHLGLLAAVRKKAVYAKDVRQVLTYVETGNADAGIVYRTDALITSRVRVVAVAPADSHDSILYPAALVKDTKNPAAARAFLKFLSGPQARAVFAKYGFASPEKRAEAR